MNAGDLARAALAYARRGLRVHPCRPDSKLPLLDDWPHRATFDPTTIESWWRRWPTANVAIATGGEARLLVVDIDPDSNGEASMTALEREHGAMPATAEVITPRGGRHLYLVVPSGRPTPGNSAGKLGAGVDTRGRHGYVVCPPSTVGGRAYAWSVDSGDRIAEAPHWLLDLLDQKGGNSHATPPEEWQAIALAGVDEGQRNQTLARVSGLLFRRLPDPILAAELIACFNAVKCRPPLEAAELKRTIDSIAAKEMRRRGLS
jgi:Bifunctional DNA primase/polymerase, N-terminal/Primase C terminal 1 (PriCT-1)